ncbi:dipeptidase [Marinilabiliaceae bacterium JC040]|nr:dipeptidase [Marinilabiliaceae bacterium JC040]
MKKLALMLFVVIFAMAGKVSACTNFIFTKSSTVDGSVMVTYAADSHTLFGELYFWPAQDWAKGSMLDVVEWDTGKFLGKIPQVAHTYNVIGNMNEHQLAIAESTYGGRKELKGANGIMDYGSLIYIALQRCKTAREAIKTIAELANTYGYASSGESFSIVDKEEAWIMELIGKGADDKGIVWVARMIPDGYVSGHANQARITTFPLSGKTSISSDKIEKIYNKEITTVYSKDVISFAKEKGFYPKKAKNKHFSFSDVYAPVDFGAARFCDARVWAFFNHVTKGMDKYWDYAKGNVKYDRHGRAKGRMPLWVKPTKKQTVQDAMSYMRDHLEGTELDMTKDAGAGPFGCPYRWRPMTWKVDGKTYCHERTTATQQTGFSFVAQCRNYLPNEIGGIIWFGVDDASSSVYFPMYTSATKVPMSFAAHEKNDMMKFDNKQAFWVFSQVTNYAYTRYNLIHAEIAKKQNELETNYVKYVKMTDAAAMSIYKQDKKAAVEYLTDFSCSTGDNLTDTWRDFYGYLFAKYMDGNVKTFNPNQMNPDVKQPGYSEKFLRTIVKDHGKLIEMPKGAH